MEKNMMKELNIVKVEYLESVIEAKDTVTLKFKIPDGFSWTPGMHFHLAMSNFAKGGKPDKSMVRSFSVMSLMEEGYLGLTTRITNTPSKYKKQLLTLKPSDKMLMFKTGNRMELRRENRPIVLISMGVGLATFRPLIKSFEKDRTGITNVISLNIDSSLEYVYKEEIEKITIDELVNIYCKSRKDLYNEIDKVLDREVSSDTPIYYIVGSDNFLKSISSYLMRKDVDVKDLVIDKNDKGISEIINS